MIVEILAPLLNFAVVIFILWKFGRQPFRDFLAARSTNLENEMKDAATQSAEAKKQLQVWEANWKSSEAHAKQIFEEAVHALARFRENALNAARQEAERVRREGGLVGQSEILKAKAALQRDLARKSVQVAGQFLQSHLGEKDRHKLISEYVEIVGNGSVR